MSPSARVLLLAGEASGDAYGGRLAAALRHRLGPDVHLEGTGGPAMEAQGVALLAGLDTTAVMGFAEVLGRLAPLRRLEKRIGAALADGRYDVVVPIDYAGFNLRIMRRAHACGVPTVWYVAPKVWAWRARRIEALRSCGARVACILPFEEAYFRKRGVDARYVGNPLMDRDDDVADRASFCRRWGLDPERPILAVLPGSRRQELRYHLGPFTEAARAVAEARPGVQPVLGRARHLPPGSLEGVGLPVVDEVRALQRHGEAALVKSGTATLETALEGTPQVMAYRMHPLTWAIVRRRLKLEHYALANLVAGARVVPEFVQDAMTPAALRDALLPLLDPAGDARRRQEEGMAEIRRRVGGPGAAARVADMVAETLGAP